MNVHCCNPILDTRDSARESERSLELSRLVANRVIDRATMAKFQSGENRCRLKTGCQVKALYGMMIHSQYDIIGRDFETICDNHEFVQVWSVMHFDARVFYMDRLIMDDIQATVIVSKGKIRFVFNGDQSLTYEHDHSEYIKTIFGDYWNGHTGP